MISWFGGHGGHGTGQFFHIRDLAVDSKGNIYLGESFGQRVMRWSYKGMWHQGIVGGSRRHHRREDLGAHFRWKG